MIDALGTIVSSITLPTRRGAEGVLTTAMEATLSVAASAGVSVSDVNAIGIGIPGTVDPQRGTVRYAVNVGIGHDDVELGARLAGELGCAVHVENDVRAAALGADWYLANKNGAVNDLAYLSIGTGIAAGYVERGQLRRGTTLVAGEIGHIPIDPSGPLCACGQIGCIEAISSGSAIERLWPTEKGTSAGELHRAASEGDPVAWRLWAGVIAGLSRAVLLLALTWDPEVIVLSGGVASLGDALRGRDCGSSRDRRPPIRVPRLARPRIEDADHRAVGRSRSDRSRSRRARRRTGAAAMTSLEVRGGMVQVDAACIAAHVFVDGALITSVGPTDAKRAEHVVDAADCSVLPGFVDLQVNGAVGVDLTTQPERIGEVAVFLAECGVTSFMPTVISSSPLQTADAIAVMREWSGAGDLDRGVQSGSRSLGVHLEGPFLNPIRPGAHPLQHVRPPSLAEARGWSRETGVAMVTIAPELPGALSVIGRLVENGVSVCAGHTDANASEIRAAVAAGLGGATHLFNAMGAMSARLPGPAGAILVDPDLIAGLIVDGLHVDPVMVRLAWQMLGPDRLALVSDSISALGLPHGTYSIGDTAVVVDDSGARTSDGVLAGSVLRFDEGLRKLIAFTGCELTEASVSASATPARLARQHDIGWLTPGYRADIVVIDEDHRVVVTIVGGRVVFDPQRRCSIT